MMHRPWDCAQPDEWLPRSLRLCWGSGDSSDSGGATTGGGDWGSSGAYDASGFDAGGIGAWGGTAYDASVFGTGMGGGGDWGSFGDTNYAGFNAPNPTFADVAGPNPGVTTGGGDWGSAGTFSAAGTGGGPGGAMFGTDTGAAQGAGGGFYGGGGGEGGVFGGYGGGGGGYTGGGGESYAGGGHSMGGGLASGAAGSFGSFGSGTLGASNAVAAPAIGPTGSAFADSYGGGSLAGPAGQASSGAPTTSEAQTQSAEGEGAPSEGEAAPTEDAAPAQSDFGTPAAPEAAPEAEAAPSLSDGAPAGMIGGPNDAAPAAQPTADRGETEAAPSAFGPQSLDWGSVFEGAAPSESQAYQQASQQLSDLTQSALAPQEPAWGSVFEVPSDPGYQNDRPDGPMGPIAEQSQFESLISDIPGVTTPAWAQDIGKSLTDVNTWLAPQNQGVINYLGNLYDQATQPNWGSVFEGAAGPSQAYQQGTQDLSNLTQSALAPTDVNWGSVFEGAAPDSGINPGAEQTGIVEASPGIEAFIPGGQQTDFTGYESLPGGAITAFIPGGQTTDFEYATPTTEQPAPAPDATHPYAETLDTGQPGAPTTTDTAATKGSDPALSGLPADATLGQPTAGQPGTQGQPATAPAQGGSLTVATEASNNIANATSNAAQDVGAPSQAGDAASQAAYNASLNLNSPSEIATAAMAAALEAGATQAQADAIAAAALNAANNQTAFTPGQPGQQQQAPPGQQQPGAPEGEQTTSTTSAFIPGQLQTNFEYESSQPAPQSLIDMAQPTPGQPQSSIPGGRATDFNYLTTSTMPTGQPGGIGSDIVASPDDDDHDTPEPPDTPQPQDPNAPRPPGNIPGQLIGARDNYPNSHLDNPRNPFYQNSGRTNYTQGRPGVDYRTARQAGVVPNFHVGDYNVQDLDARLVENINRAIVAMERAGIPNTLTVSSAYRPSTRAEAAERGMDERTSQESVYARGHAPGGVHFAAGPPGGSNHGPGRALDFNPGLSGRALTWLRANAREYGLETLGYRGGRPYDVPHIQLQGGGRGPAGARPSAQEQAEQRAIDAQNRQAAAERGQARTQQATAPPGGWRGIGSDRSDIAWTEQPQVEQPAALPPPTMPLAPDRPPADIPAPTPRGPNEFDIPVTPPVRNATVIANNILKQATAHLNTNSDTAALNAAGVVAAKAMAAAGIPANLARSLMLKGAMDGAIANGYGPGGPRSTVMGFSIWGKVQSTITDSINAAMQGYQPAKPGEVQGPPSPATPGKQGAAPSGQRYAGASSQLFGPTEEDLGREGDVSAREAIRPWDIMPLEQLSPIIAPPAPQSPPYQPPPAPQYTPGGPGMFNPFRGNEANLGGLFHLAAGGRDAGAPPVIGPELGPGRAEWESSRPGGPMGFDPNVLIEGPQSTPPAPPPAFQAPSINDRGIDPYLFMLQQLEQQQYQQDLQSQGWRALAKGGHVAKDEPVVVGEEGPEFFVPDQSGTVVPHMPQPGKGKNVDRWPKIPAVNYPGRYGGVEREIERQTREAQNPMPSLIDLIDSGRLPLNAANWHQLINNPSLIALGQSRIEDRREGINPGAEQYGTEQPGPVLPVGTYIPTPASAAEPPDPANPMAQALGYGSIRRPMQIGRQSYSQ